MNPADAIRTLPDTSNHKQPFRLMLDVKVPMRDRVRLSADVYLSPDGYRFPVLLERTYFGNSDPSAVARALEFVRWHRIRIEVSSSNFPRFERNLNTSGQPGLTDEMRVARQVVFHDPERPSHVTLPEI